MSIIPLYLFLTRQIVPVITILFLPKFSKFDAFALTGEEKKTFIVVNAIKNLPWEEQLKIIRKLYAQRMKTTYNVSYCETGKISKNTSITIPNAESRKVEHGYMECPITKEEAKSKFPNEDMKIDDDTLLGVADQLYKQKTAKTLQPLPSSRRVLGYCRPAYYYTGFSEYQDEYSRHGYLRLIPNRGGRQKQRLPFCDQFKS